MTTIEELQTQAAILLHQEQTLEIKKQLKNIKERIRYYEKKVDVQPNVVELAVEAIEKLVTTNEKRRWLCGKAYHVFRSRVKKNEN